jgi:hypothetical protein
MPLASCNSQGHARALDSAPGSPAPPIVLPPLRREDLPRWVIDAHRDAYIDSLDSDFAPHWADVCLENLDLDAFDEQGFLLPDFDFEAKEVTS